MRGNLFAKVITICSIWSSAVLLGDFTIQENKDYLETADMFPRLKPMGF